MNTDDGAEVGTCALCGQEMIRTPDDCWHPWSVERACPPEPGRMTESRENFDAWQVFHAAGLRPGRPGREHFVAVKSGPWIAFPGKVPVCRDCGTDWQPVRRGECVKCGSDAGPLISVIPPGSAEDAP